MAVGDVEFALLVETVEPVETGLVEIKRPRRPERLRETLLRPWDPVDVADAVEGPLVRDPSGKKADEPRKVVADGLV